MRIRFSPQHIPVIWNVPDESDYARDCAQERMVIKSVYAKSISPHLQFLRLSNNLKAGVRDIQIHYVFVSQMWSALPVFF